MVECHTLHWFRRWGQKKFLPKSSKDPQDECIDASQALEDALRAMHTILLSSVYLRKEFTHDKY